MSMTQTQNPPKWHEVYPQGTAAGDEECKFFRALARDPNYEWRSVGAIAKESGLSRKRVEEIIAKYYPTGIVVQSQKNEENYGYWERVAGKKKKDRSLAQEDQSSRVKKHQDKDDDDTAAVP